MAINTTNINTLYDTLESKATATIDKYVNDYSIKESDRATMIASVLNNIISTSVQAVLQEEVNAQQIASMQNEDTLKTSQTNADVALKASQKAKVDYETSSILPKDGDIKTKQALLIDRQKTAYEDNLRVEEAKAYKDFVFGYAVGGSSTPPSDMNTTALNLINAITQ